MHRKILLKLFLATCLVITSSCSALEPRRVELSQQFHSGDRYMNIRLLGTLELPTKLSNGTSMNELSGLAWDEDEQILYAISDQGTLFHLQPSFHDNQLHSLEVLQHYPLQNKKGKPLEKNKRDTEGLALDGGRNGKRGDSQLIVSFEGKPRIARFSKEGKWLGKEKVPQALTHSKNLRGNNNGLEAVTRHPEFGIVTAPEKPLKTSSSSLVTLYSEKKSWNFPSIPWRKSSVVALETLPDDSLLVMERRITSPLEAMIISLRKVNPSRDCNTPTGSCTTQTIATFNSAEGWEMDNFEGLTRHRDNRFFMVSDNNQFWVQRTLLVYFEILEN